MKNKIEFILSWDSQKIATVERLKRLVSTWEEFLSFLNWYFEPAALAEEIWEFSHDFKMTQCNFADNCKDSLFNFVLYREKETGVFTNCDVYLGSFLVQKYTIDWDSPSVDEFREQKIPFETLDSNIFDNVDWAIWNVLNRDLIADVWRWCGLNGVREMDESCYAILDTPYEHYDLVNCTCSVYWHKKAPDYISRKQLNIVEI